MDCVFIETYLRTSDFLWRRDLAGNRDYRVTQIEGVYERDNFARVTLRGDTLIVKRFEVATGRTQEWTLDL